MQTRLLIAVAAIVTIALTLDAQPARDVDARKRAAQRAAIETFLDRARPDKDRLAAVRHFGYPDERQFAALLAIGADRSQSDEIRLEAFRKHRFDDKWLDLILKILDDPNDGGPVLDAGLTELLNQRATFKLPAEVRQRIQATWRRLLDDPRERVRLAAYRALVSNHDQLAITRLSDSLRQQANVPIPLVEAIDLLDVDGSINHISAIRPYLGHADPAVRAFAARALAVDPESRQLIVRMAVSSSSPEEVRLHALRALAREDERYGSYAIGLVDNAQEDGDVRYAAMSGFAGRMNYNRVPAEQQIAFAQAVERIAAGRQELVGTTKSDKIRAEAKKLLAYLKQAFPAVARFYANR